MIILKLSRINFIVKYLYDQLEVKCYKEEKKLSLLNKHFKISKFNSIPAYKFVKALEKYDSLPTIYIITPTDSKRITQLAALTRMRNTLWLVPKIFWIVVEDNSEKSEKLKLFLDESKLPHVHLLAETPDAMKIKPGERHKPKGVIQRNAALAWIRENKRNETKGVVFFGDDDNTYDYRLFEEVLFKIKFTFFNNIKN